MGISDNGYYGGEIIIQTMGRPGRGATLAGAIQRRIEIDYTGWIAVGNLFFDCDAFAFLYYKYLCMRDHSTLNIFNILHHGSGKSTLGRPGT